MPSNYDNGPGEMQYCVPKVPYKTPQGSNAGVPCADDSHIEETGEREDAAGYNVYMGATQSGQRSQSGD